jgi:hypothetical protein
MAASAIRLRFVPALVEKLISVGFSPVRDRAKIVTHDDEIGTGGSLAIQHVVEKSDSKSILSREQKLNQRESSIRR